MIRHCDNSFVNACHDFSWLHFLKYLFEDKWSISVTCSHCEHTGPCCHKQYSIYRRGCWAYLQQWSVQSSAPIRPNESSQGSPFPWFCFLPLLWNYSVLLHIVFWCNQKVPVSPTSYLLSCAALQSDAWVMMQLLTQLTKFVFGTLWSLLICETILLQ